MSAIPHTVRERGQPPLPRPVFQPPREEPAPSLPYPEGPILDAYSVCPTCPRCHRCVRKNRDGRLRRHYLPLMPWQRRQHPVPESEVCPGSGLPTRAVGAR